MPGHSETPEHVVGARPLERGVTNAGGLGFIPGVAMTAFMIVLAYSCRILVRGDAGGGRPDGGDGE